MSYASTILVSVVAAKHTIQPVRVFVKILNTACVVALVDPIPPITYRPFPLKP